MEISNTNKKLNIVQLTSSETLAIRHTVLWPKETLDFCKVEGDKDALHYGIKKDDKLVCVASIFINDNSVRLRKFATLVEFQEQGIGSFLIEHILLVLQEKDIKTFWCDARQKASSLYEKFGMKKKGEVFYKADIPYIVMEKDLS